ncbi:unnamed protein product [Schistosoma curassoni]|nr:unnamed protein product [Schistosoma curassoni]
MDRYSHILTVDGSTVDVYDDDDIYIIAQNATEIDLSGQYLMRDDYKLLEWRLALRYASSLINSRLDFSNAHEKFTRVFDQVEFPMDLNELTYTYEAQELQGAAIHMDPRTCIPPAYNPKYKSILEIMFNPWIIKTNFRADLPKNYIWK